MIPLRFLKKKPLVGPFAFDNPVGFCWGESSAGQPGTPIKSIEGSCFSMNVGEYVSSDKTGSLSKKRVKLSKRGYFVS